MTIKQLIAKLHNLDSLGYGDLKIVIITKDDGESRDFLPPVPATLPGWEGKEEAVIYTSC